MTATTPSAVPSASRLRYLLPMAVAASVIHLLMMIPGYSEAGRFQATEWLIVLAISLVVSVLVFALVVPRAGAVTSLVLAVLGLLAVGVFWAGLALPLAAAAAVAGWNARQRDSRRGIAIAALAVAAVAVVALVVVIAGDAMAS